MMTIGALKVKLRLPQNQSLKGKRGTLKSITAKAKNKFNVSIAEVEDQNLWQLATLGISCVSNDGRHANETLSKVANFIECSSGEAEFLDYEIEIMRVL
ncbi:DUF503 domain-containing protein [Chloroflexota bacterium]